MKRHEKGFCLFWSVLQRYKWLYITLTVVVVIVSITFSSSYFITPLYKSTLVMFPSATNSVSRILVSTSIESKDDVLGFGEDERVDQMLQVLNSSEIFDNLNRHYDLMKHYKINDNSQNKYSQLYNIMSGNIQFKRTENRAIKVIVYDEDPNLAADMANYISRLYDTVMFNIQRERALTGFNIAEREYSKAKAEVKKLEDSLANAKDNSHVNGVLFSTVDKLDWERKQLVALKAKYDELRVDAFEFMPHKFVVSKAYPADAKSYPLRWLIVLTTLCSVLFFATILILMIDKNKLNK